MQWWHFHRQLALPTHLQLRLEDWSHSSVFVDSSRLVLYPLPLSVSLVSSRCTAGLLLILSLCSSLLDLVELAAPPYLDRSKCR